MDKTTFAGLTRLDPNESLSVDGYSFQHINPQIIDRLLGIGAVSHRHDGHAALPDPADLPTITEIAGGGQIPADTTVWCCYTLIDAQGGETRPSTAQSVTTPAPLDPPDASPSVVLDTTAGTLLANTYMYAVTLLDGNGGETTQGPAMAVTRPPGPANARMMISGLTAICTASGATGWRLWRSVGGGRWGFLATGPAATNTFTDDGASSPDCTMNPPSRNTTNSVNQVRVVVPTTQPAGTASYRIYLSEDGNFSSPSLAGTYLIGVAGTNQDFPALDPADGAPPAVSLSIPGASQINAATDVYGLTWKASVATLAGLPAVGNADGDVRITRDTRIAYVWDAGGADWAVLFTGFVKAPVANAAALPGVGNTHGDMRVTMDDFALHVWGNDNAWHNTSGGGSSSALTWTPLDFATVGGNWEDAYPDGWGDVAAQWAIDGNFLVYQGAVKCLGDFDIGDTNAYISRLPVGSRPPHSGLAVTWGGPDGVTQYAVKLMQEGTVFGGHGTLLYAGTLAGEAATTAADAHPPRQAGLVVGLDGFRFAMN